MDSLVEQDKKRARTHYDVVVDGQDVQNGGIKQKTTHDHQNDTSQDNVERPYQTNPHNHLRANDLINLAFDTGPTDHTTKPQYTHQLVDKESLHWPIDHRGRGTAAPPDALPLGTPLLVCYHPTTLARTLTKLADDCVEPPAECTQPLAKLESALDEAHEAAFEAAAPFAVDDMGEAIHEYKPRAGSAAVRSVVSRTHADRSVRHRMPRSPARERSPPHDSTSTSSPCARSIQGQS